MKRGRGFSASPAQRAKVRDEFCRYCLQGWADPAHVIDRALGGCDHEDCVIPLCRAHHRAYDEGTLDILPILRPEEQAHAAGHVGIARAYWRTTNDRRAA